jgi:hypothetical protein
MGQFESIKFQPKRPLLRELSADRLNAILQEIRRNKPKGERGITVRQSGDSTYIGLAAAIPVGGGAAAPRKPWDIYVEDVEGEEGSITYTLKVQPGTITNILADNWDDEWTVGEDEFAYGVATISTDGKNITGISIAITSEAPSQQTPQKFAVQESVGYLFGLFYNGATYNLLGESIFLYPRLSLVTSADPAAQPGESPFDLWYELGP